MTCLDDRRLLDVHYGDTSAAERAHLAGCATCAARLRTLQRDLGRIDTVLRETVPLALRAPRRAGAWRWAPIAVAAVLALAVGVWRHAAEPVVADADDTLTLALELSDAMAPHEFFDDEPTARSSTARSTCTWGDPLLGVGCDEPAVMRIAWR
jgi:hypothetical protein